MIRGESVLAVIPARGGSKGIPRKNLRVVAGKSLLAWSIETARKSRCIDRLVVSSEDQEILSAAAALACEVLVRPSELAADDTPGIAPVLHALSALPAHDWVVLLQPTSPLRWAEDIDGAIEAAALAKANACVSVSRAHETPYWMFTMDEQRRMVPVLSDASSPQRRQDAPEVYVLNGAVYVARCGWLLQTRSFLSPETRGYAMAQDRAIDVDTERDLRLVQLMLEESSGRI